MRGIHRHNAKRVGLSVARITGRGARFSARHSKRIVVKTAAGSKKAAIVVHHHTARRPHSFLATRFSRYANWHQHRFHKHVHYGVLGSYLLVIAALLFSSTRFVFAADQVDNWDFSTPSDYVFGDGVEASGNAAQLKAQEYASDGNTAALYPFNETSGSTAEDSSANNNDLSLQNSPSFAAGNLNNGLTLNGTSQYAEAPDSSSLSVTGQQTIEGWVKPDATFDDNASQSQTIVDKGSYKMGFDRSSGKAFYEIQNNNSEQWTKRLGDDQAGSWSINHGNIESSVNYGNDVYVGVGSSRADAEVWRWRSNAWTKIGGDGLRSGWQDQVYEQVSSMAINGTAMYAGLGSSAGDGEVWVCELSTDCLTWTKIGGDGTGIPTNAIIDSMTVHSGSLYVGTGSTAGMGDVYRYNGGTSWTQIGGDGLNSGWAASTYEDVWSLTSDGTNLYAGLGTTAGDAEVWRWNGAAWTKIGGDAVNSSWNTGYEAVESLTAFGGNVYAGLGNSSLDAEVWRWNGTAWTLIGGDGVNGTWNNNAFSRVMMLKNDGTDLYAGLGSGTNGGSLWKYSGSTWTQIGGASIAGTANTNNVRTLVFADSKMYVGAYGPAGQPGGGFWEVDGSTWTAIGGSYINNSWGGWVTSDVTSSTTYNGKMYVGLGITSGTAVVFEYDGTTSRLVGGNRNYGSWDPWTYERVSSLTTYKGELYAGLGQTAGDGEVWKWDGSTWTKVGGDGLNSSWATSTQVSAMTVWEGELYAGLGAPGAVDARIYKYNGTSWTQVNPTWSPNMYIVTSLQVFGDKLCAGGGGNGSAFAPVHCYDGSNWTHIGGGNSANGSWGASSNTLISLSEFEDELYAGVATGAHSLKIWKWNGSTWTQVGGDGLNGTWSDGDYTYLDSFAEYNGQLYAGVGFSGSSNPSGDVWRWNGSTWTQVGGDGINNSWSTAGFTERVTTLVRYNGKLYAGLGFTANVDPMMYSFGNNAYVESDTASFGSSWTHLAATYNGVDMKIYINGSEDASVAASASGVNNTLPLRVGAGYGSTQGGEGQAYFKGQLDEIRISNAARTSFNSRPYLSSPQTVSLATAARKVGILDWESFTANESANGGTITYRLSDDEGETWKYWNGSNWVESSALSDSNPASVVSDNIADFAVGFGGIMWQAVLDGDGNQRVTLNSVELGSNLDADAPAANASAIQAQKSNGGAALGSGSWTNGASPYFSWTAGTDAGSGIKGYCLYLGTDGSADPVSTKGLLGTSPEATGGSCQFVIGTNSIDLATSGYLASPLTTSNSDYHLRIKAIDNAGNVFGSAEQFTFKFDNTAPSNPGYVTAPASFINTKTATFTWPTSGGNAPADPNSGIAGLQYRINDTDWYGDDHTGTGDINDLLDNDGEYTTIDPTDFDNIEDGINTVYFRTWDQAGNVTGNYATAALKVNTSGAPSEPQNIQATPTTNTTNSFAFEWDPPNTFVGSANSLTYCYTVNVVPSSSNCNYTVAGDTDLAAAAYATQPGTNTLYVVARDESNNINYSSYGSVTFTANTPAPGIPTNIDIADVSVKTNNNWRLAITWDEPESVGAGVSAYRVLRSTNNSTFTQVGTSSSTSYVDTGLSQTTYYYKVKACDSANNCGADTGVVSMLPTGKFTTPASLVAQPSVTNVTTKKARISWSTDRASDSKIALGTKSGSYSPSEVGNSNQVTSHSLDLDNLAAGTTYYFKAKWTDEDGNTGTSQEYTFTTAPAPVLKEVETTATTLSGAIVQFTSKQATKVNIYFGKTEAFGGVKSINTSLSESSYTFNLTGLDDGAKYFYKLSTFDEEGSEYDGNIFSFTTPPRPQINDLRFQPVEGEPTSTQRVSWTTNVPTSSQLVYGKVGVTGLEVNDSRLKTKHEMTIRSLEDNSKYFLVAQGRDAGGNVASSDRQEFKTALDTRPPEVSDISIEVSIKGTGAEARGQVIVSWKTDEPSGSQVAYAEGSDVVEFNNKSTLDDTLTTEHIVIVSDLPTSKLYSIQPLSRDRSGNEGKGEVQSAIVGKASDSVLTIILNTLQGIFGF